MQKQLNIYVAVHATHVGKHKLFDDERDQRAWWREYNSGFVNRTMTPEEFINAITDGYGYTSVHNRYRHQRNFICGQVVSVDIDDGTPVERLLDDDRVMNHAYYIYTTPSHTPEHPRLRVVYVFPKPVRSVNSFKRAQTAVTNLFKISDASCKDPCRLFFGSKGARVWHIGKILDFETMGAWVEETEAEEKRRIEEKMAQYAGGESADDASITPARRAGMTEWLMQRVLDAPDGEKHTTLFNTALMAGGMAATGWWSEQECIAFLYKAISQRQSVKSLAHAHSTIVEAVGIGLTKPIHIPSRRESPAETAGRAISSLDDVHPPLTRAQREQVETVVHRAVKEAHWLSYHKGYADAVQQLTGLPRETIDDLKIGRRAQRIDTNTGEILSCAATSVPIWNDGEVVNVVYLADDGETIEMEREEPAPYPTLIDHDNAVLMLPPNDAIMMACIVGLTPDPPFGVGMVLPVPPSREDRKHLFPVGPGDPEPAYGRWFPSAVNASHLVRVSPSLGDIEVFAKQSREVGR